ncbi:MAG: segregation/condensation protein A [Clostridia bacterium]|nr:segregation/condensation protein A [Clostridia bacterium]
MSEPTYKLEQFEGPLDLLLSLCQKNKVDITDIPIALICRQYLDYLAEAERMDMDVAGEFIVMASELMAIKAKMLLPRTGDDQEDPRKELADALLLLQQAKEAAAELKPLYEEYSGRMVKDNDEIPPENGFPLGLDTGLLTKALNVLLARFKSFEQPPQTVFDPLIKRRVVSVEEKIDEIMDILEIQESASLFFLLKDAENRSDLLARFIGILELVKLQRIVITEDNTGVEPDESDEIFLEPDTGGLRIRFRLNPDYQPSIDGNVSEYEYEEEQDGAGA